MAVFPAPEGPEINMAVLSPIPSLSLSSESPSLIWKSESLSASHHSSVWLLVWLLDALLFCFAKSLEKQKTVQYSASSYNIVVILTNMVPTIFPPNWCCIDCCNWSPPCLALAICGRRWQNNDVYIIIIIIIIKKNKWILLLSSIKKVRCNKNVN